MYVHPYGVFFVRNIGSAYAVFTLKVISIKIDDFVVCLFDLNLVGFVSSFADWAIQIGSQNQCTDIYDIKLR